MQFLTSWEVVEIGQLLREGCTQKFRVRMSLMNRGIAIAGSEEATAALCVNAVTEKRWEDQAAAEKQYTHLCIDEPDLESKETDFVHN